MKLLNYVVVAIPLVVCGISSHSATAALTDKTTSGPVMRVGGETVSRDDLTSFAMLVEQNETGVPVEGQELLDEYVLTKLYDKIPTTASVPVAEAAAASTPFPAIGQRNFLKRELREKLLKEVQVPRADLEAWYEKNVSRYQQPERVHAWHIFKETSDENATSAPEKVREELKNIKAKIDSGTSFSAAAKEYSEAASGEKGGEIGYITPRQPIGPLNKPMNPELEDVFFKLPVNQVSDVVETRHGMHLLYITEKHTTTTPTVDDLVTSGILPGVLSQDRVTSEMAKLVQEAIDKHHGELLPSFKDTDPINNGTVIFEFDGRKTTMGDLAKIFGERFTKYVETIKNDKPAFRKLMQQGMEDEAMVLAAADQGLTNNPQTSATLQAIAQRAAASKRISAIIEAESSVTEQDIKAKYEEVKEQLRQPEAAGYVVHVDVEQTSGTAEEAKARDEALKKAEKLAEKMKSLEFEAFVKELQANPAEKATAIQVTRHALNRSTEPITREFDRGAVTIDGLVGVSKPMPLGDKMVLVKVEQRWPGEPIALTEVQDRIKTVLESEKRANLRKALVQRLVEKGLVEFLPGAAQYGVTAAQDDSTTTTATGTTATM
jgi:parvulin-like peptidyl-prolyl isomerase